MASYPSRLPLEALFEVVGNFATRRDEKGHSGGFTFSVTSIYFDSAVYLHLDQLDNINHRQGRQYSIDISQSSQLYIASRLHFVTLHRDFLHSFHQSPSAGA